MTKYNKKTTQGYQNQNEPNMKKMNRNSYAKTKKGENDPTIKSHKNTTSVQLH